MNKIKEFNNDNLIKVFDVAYNDQRDEVAIIMERCDGGDLKIEIENKLKNNSFFQLD